MTHIPPSDHQRDRQSALLKAGRLLTHYWRYYTSPAVLSNLPKFGAMRGRYRDQRCFILGNGPSLKRTDLSKLETEYTFGLNRIYLMFDELGFETSFLVSVNALVLEQCAVELSKLGIPKFLGWSGYHAFPSQARAEVFWLNTFLLPSLPRFAKTPTGPMGLWEGVTVTYVALQLAYFLGFSEAILVGVDHNFTTQGPPHREVVTDAEGDPNHFSKDYFGPGFRWQLPDLETSELSYALARYYFHLDGRRIRDATVDGKLTIFPKVSYESLF